MFVSRVRVKASNISNSSTTSWARMGFLMGSHYIVPEGPELVRQARLTLNSQRCNCLDLPSSEIEVVPSQLLWDGMLFLLTLSKGPNLDIHRRCTQSHSDSSSGNTLCRQNVWGVSNGLVICKELGVESEFPLTILLLAERHPHLSLLSLHVFTISVLKWSQTSKMELVFPHDQQDSIVWHFQKGTRFQIHIHPDTF